MENLFSNVYFSDSALLLSPVPSPVLVTPAGAAAVSVTIFQRRQRWLRPLAEGLHCLIPNTDGRRHLCLGRRVRFRFQNGWILDQYIFISVFDNYDHYFLTFLNKKNNVKGVLRISKKGCSSQSLDYLFFKVSGD